MYPQLMHFFCGYFANPEDFSTGQVFNELFCFVRRDQEETIGLLMSEAILARNLLIEIPAEAVSPVFCLISFFISFAMIVADPIFFLSAVTSRNASSIERGSITSVYSWSISSTCWDIHDTSQTCAYKYQPGAKSFCRQRWHSRSDPNFLAS